MCYARCVEHEQEAADGAMVSALNLVSERWSLLLIRELLTGPKRFTDLKNGLPEISTNVLAQRLRRLVGTGVIARYKLPPPAASQVYALTDWGLRLEPVIRLLGIWGTQTTTE